MVGAALLPALLPSGLLSMAEAPVESVKAEGEVGAGGEDFINLKVKSAQHAEIWFRVKRTTALQKLMRAYCERNNQDPAGVVFLFDGERIRTDQTPADLDMEDKDEIDAMMHQTGGGDAAPTPRPAKVGRTHGFRW